MKNYNLRRRGIQLEYGTLVWNLIGFIPLIVWSHAQKSLSLLGFGVDSMIEILASVVVIWQLNVVSKRYEKIAVKIIGMSFLFLSGYLILQSILNYKQGLRPAPSYFSIGWLLLTALLMFALAAGKKHVGRLLNNPVLLAESKVTVVDGLLAVSVLTGMLCVKFFGWIWMDLVSTGIIAVYGIREALHSLKS